MGNRGTLGAARLEPRCAGPVCRNPARTLVSNPFGPPIDSCYECLPKWVRAIEQVRLIRAIEADDNTVSHRRRERLLRAARALRERRG